MRFSIPRHFTFALALGSLQATATRLSAQVASGQQAGWDSVGGILQTAPAPNTGYVRYNFPRRDITLKVRDVTVSPALA